MSYLANIRIIPSSGNGHVESQAINQFQADTTNARKCFGTIANLWSGGFNTDCPNNES